MLTVCIVNLHRPRTAADAIVLRTSFQLKIRRIRLIALLSSKDAFHAEERYYKVLAELIGDEKMVVTARILPRSKATQLGSLPDATR